MGYTTDGSVPSASNGQVYHGPIMVSVTTSIAAVAMQEGLVDSNVNIATYRIGDAAVAEKQVKSYHIGNSLTDTVWGYLEPISAIDGEYGGKFIELARKYNPQAQAWLYAQWVFRDGGRFDGHCIGAGRWSPPNRKPSTWEEAMANKMLYYLEVKKIWDTQCRARANNPCQLRPAGPALTRLKKEIETGKVPGIDNFYDAVFADIGHLNL